MTHDETPIETSEAAALSDDDMRELRKAADMCGLSQEFAVLELRASQPATAPVVPADVVALAREAMQQLERYEYGCATLLFRGLVAELAAAPAAPVVPQPAEKWQRAAADWAAAVGTAISPQDDPTEAIRAIVNAARSQPAAQQGEAAARCELVTSCKSCRHAMGRQSCALAQRDFDGGRPAAPPDWCPLPLYTAPPARQAVALTDEQIATMRQAGYLDADDYPDAWAYERGVRDAERAHGITPAGGEAAR